MSADNQTPADSDKKIPLSVMVIGTFEIAVALLGLVILVLVARLDLTVVPYLVILLIYGAIGAGLWAIHEWARAANVVLHIIAIPYALYTSLVLEGTASSSMLLQIIISLGIIWALTRSHIRHKFQTAGPKQNKR